MRDLLSCFNVAKLLARWRAHGWDDILIRHLSLNMSKMELLVPTPQQQEPVHSFLSQDRKAPPPAVQELLLAPLPHSYPSIHPIRSSCCPQHTSERTFPLSLDRISEPPSKGFPDFSPGPYTQFSIKQPEWMFLNLSQMPDFCSKALWFPFHSGVKAQVPTGTGMALWVPLFLQAFSFGHLFLPCPFSLFRWGLHWLWLPFSDLFSIDLLPATVPYCIIFFCLFLN